MESNRDPEENFYLYFRLSLLKELCAHELKLSSSLIIFSLMYSVFLLMILLMNKLNIF
jgi:hypothetical protein